MNQPKPTYSGSKKEIRKNYENKVPVPKIDTKKAISINPE